uniref:Uncharacterized protein n=1 Tax=Nelumbo nucifera TaxID=4432 RepID=A0A822YHL8_NELNU|nr:TPA_asm: hypothetical protein HUJ06_012535 [Nelumbo nucifera]
MKLPSDYASLSPYSRCIKCNIYFIHVKNIIIYLLIYYMHFYMVYCILVYYLLLYILVSILYLHLK